MTKGDNALRIGWAETDITPPEKVGITGQFHLRVSEKVFDPLTATVLYVDSGDDVVVMVSCDLVSISDCLHDDVRRQLKSELPELDPSTVSLCATHTHTGPVIDSAYSEDLRQALSHDLWEKLGIMSASAYTDFAARRIVAAIKEARANLRPGGVGYGTTHAVVGHNRRWTAHNGASTMYGDTSTDTFSHVEGWEDHSLRLLATWDREGNVTGVVVNVACPSQVSESEYGISADFWHETRVAIRRRLGADVYILPQCAPAGDLSPHFIVNKREAQRRQRLKGQSRREEIADIIATAVADAVPWMARDIDWNATITHERKRVALTRRSLTEEDVEKALVQAGEYERRFNDVLGELVAGKGLDDPRWYVPLTMAFRRARWYKSVETRYESRHEPYEADVHVFRLGAVVFATNPFELYVDFGLQIQNQSPAQQTFLVQLAGGGTYLSTQRATASGAYGSEAPSNVVGPEGGGELVAHTLAMIKACFEPTERQSVST